MQLSPSAHVDSFCRDRLPPFDQWPELLFELPELHYPTASTAPPACSTARSRAGAPTVRACSAPGTAWTYGELLARANQVANVLIGLGVVPGNRVLLRGPEQPVAGGAAWLGVLKAGAVAVATMPMLRAHELTKIVEVSRPTLALTDHRFAADLHAADAGLPVLRVRWRRPRRPRRHAAAARRTTSTTYRPPPTTSPCSPSPRARPAGPRRPCTSTATCMAIADTFSRHVAAAAPGRRVHRYAAAGLHLRPRRAARLPASRRRGHAVLLERATPIELDRSSPRRTASPSCSPPRRRTGRSSPPTRRGPADGPAARGVGRRGAPCRRSPSSSTS